MRWLWWWIGGAITRATGTGLVIGIFIVIYGATPGQAVADFLLHLSPWAAHAWFRLVAVIVGLVIITGSLFLNVWSLRQQAIDALAEDISWAIHHLVNRPVTTQAELDQWRADYDAWCARVSTKLDNRAFFTRADQLHFERLGFITPTALPGGFNTQHNWLLSQLRLKFERLRDVINWTQMRKR